MSKLIVSEMEKREKAIYSVHEVVDATYSTFIENGEKYFQIDTYGKKGLRANQYIQLDKKNAIELIELLQKEFNL